MMKTKQAHKPLKQNAPVRSGKEFSNKLLLEYSGEVSKPVKNDAECVKVCKRAVEASQTLVGKKEFTKAVEVLEKALEFSEYRNGKYGRRDIVGRIGQVHERAIRHHGAKAFSIVEEGMNAGADQVESSKHFLDMIRHYSADFRGVEDGLIMLAIRSGISGFEHRKRRDGERLMLALGALETGKAEMEEIRENFLGVMGAIPRGAWEPGYYSTIKYTYRKFIVKKLANIAKGVRLISVLNRVCQTLMRFSDDISLLGSVASCLEGMGKSCVSEKAMERACDVWDKYASVQGSDPDWNKYTMIVYELPRIVWETNNEKEFMGRINDLERKIF